jgi:membrane protein DedA with SNARE-associated domain
VKDWIERCLEAAGDAPGVREFVIIVLTSAVEYAVPFVPGDIVALASGILVGAKGWSLSLVFTAVLLGSTTGLSIEYAFGRWVGGHDAAWRKLSPRWARFGKLIDRVTALFDRQGVQLLTINRFLPTIRGAFFVAAGMARLPYWKVLVSGFVSAVLWNALIFTVGVALGHNREKVYGFFATYSYVVWSLLVMLVAIWLLRRARARAAPESPS